MHSPLLGAHLWGWGTLALRIERCSLASIAGPVWMGRAAGWAEVALGAAFPFVSASWSVVLARSLAGWRCQRSPTHSGVRCRLPLLRTARVEGNCV